MSEQDDLNARIAALQVDIVLLKIMYDSIYVSFFAVLFMFCKNNFRMLISGPNQKLLLKQSLLHGSQLYRCFIMRHTHVDINHMI